VSLEIHYEIFRRAGSKGEWALHDIAALREGAIQIAESLMAEGKTTGVKVVKETYYDDTGDYTSVKIFEEGHNQVKTKPAAEDLPHALPCSKSDDLYAGPARDTIARLLCEHLARNKLTVTEFIHRADALEQFEAAGTLFQFSVQKVAVAQAANTGAPVQHIIKTLNELVTKAIHRVYRDERRGAFPALKRGDFAKAAEKFAGRGDGTYILNGAIAKYLKPAKDWNDKVLRLLALLDEAAGDSAGARLLGDSLDAVAAEILHSAAALHELIGPHECLGDALVTLVDLFLGQTSENAQDGLLALCHLFANDQLPGARATVANRILAEIKSVRRLCAGSLIDEFAVLKRLASRLVLGTGKYLGHEQLVAAFALRSRRLVSDERIYEYLQTAPSPDDKLECLLRVEEEIVGTENRRQLAGFILPVVASPSFLSHFLSGKAPLLARLQRLTQLQASVLKSGFQEEQRREIADALDRVANELETRGKFFEGIESKACGPVEIATAILRLLAGAALTEGRLSTRARELVVAQLGRPGFLTSYATQQAHGAAAKPDLEAAIANLMPVLQKAGITPETGLKSIAA